MNKTQYPKLEINTSSAISSQFKLEKTQNDFKYSDDYQEIVELANLNSNYLI